MHGSEKTADAPGVATLDPPAVSPSIPLVKSTLSDLDRLTRPPGATQKLFWLYLGPFIVLHLLVVLAFVPWLFSWTGVALVFVGNYVFGSLGINLAYHRILTHQ